MPPSTDNDSIERMTVLGARVTNPYTITITKQAYANLGITNVPVTVTNLYIRFKPTIDQVSFLDSVMDGQGLELFDAPFDYQILKEGDYYQDPSIPGEQPTCQYATVPANFTYPAGIQYETLASIHIPGDSYTAVETEAERLAALQDGGGTLTAGSGAVVQPNVPQCPDGYHWDFSTNSYLACPGGYTWNGTSCEPDSPPNPNPPAPAADAAVPAGTLTVFDTQLPGATGNHLFPLRNVRIVAKRWFKVDRLYTDNNGHFQCSKRFKHKVKIKVKFKNNDAFVRSMRGVRLWQMLLPFNKTLGVYSGDKSNIVYNFSKFDNSGSGAKGNRYWSAATVFNGVQEYKDYAVQEGIGLPKNGLKILLTNLAGFGSGSSPMFNKRWYSGLPGEFVLT